MNIKYPKNNRRLTINMLALAVSLSVFAACSQAPVQEEKDEELKEVVSFPTTDVQLLNPTYTIAVPGELKPYEQVAVHAKVSGFVKQLLVDRGSYVKRGQLLAVLEAPEMQQQYYSTKSSEQKVYSDYMYAKQAYERLQEASNTTGAVAAIELDRAKGAMESAKSAYEASKAGTLQASQLKEYLRITAPFDGVVMERNVSVGALVGAGDNNPLFRVAQNNKLRLTLALPEKHAASVSKDMPVTFTVSSQPGRTFDATLSRNSNLLSQGDRALTLEFDVDNSSKDLQGGDYAQVTLNLQRPKPSFWVNSKAVLNTQKGTFLLTLEHDEVKRISVSEGIRLDTLMEVFGEINPNAKVILKPSEEIVEGKLK